jgi:hypothetical protein
MPIYGFLEFYHQKAFSGMHASKDLEVIFKLHANVIAWHFDSAINEEAGRKASDTSGNSCIKEAVKHVIRQIK